MRATSIELSVLKTLREVAVRGRYYQGRYTPWTKSILTSLATTGRAEGYKVYTSKGNKKGDQDAGEWLYDQVWIKYDKENYIQSVPLVLESELGVDARDRLDDFCKLLLARADHRIMIFGASQQNKAKAIIDNFIDEISGSGIACRGDKYLFAALLESDGSFYFKKYIKK